MEINHGSKRGLRLGPDDCDRLDATRLVRGEEQIRLLAEGLRNRGHRVHLLSAPHGVLAERMRTPDLP